MSELSNLSTQQLRRAADIKEKIDSLQYELSHILGGGASSASSRGSGMSAAGRARIAAAQRARWAKYNASKKSAAPVSHSRRKLSPAAKARIAAAARARWAKAKASGKNRL